MKIYFQRIYFIYCSFEAKNYWKKYSNNNNLFPDDYYRFDFNADYLIVASRLFIEPVKLKPFRITSAQANRSSFTL